jgi:hypothetical protein
LADLKEKMNYPAGSGQGIKAKTHKQNILQMVVNLTQRD